MASVFFSSNVLEVSVTAANISKQNGNSLVTALWNCYENIAAETCTTTILYHIMKAVKAHSPEGANYCKALVTWHKLFYVLTSFFCTS